MYQEKFFYLCKVPLSASGKEDVEILAKAVTTSEFPDVFKQYEDLRSQAFNKDGLFSIIRADDLHIIVRTINDVTAKETAFEESKPNLITNLEHRVMQGNDEHARQILKEIHDVDLDSA